MLGARLARRIVLPLVLLIGALFALLAVTAAAIADRRVKEEMEARADRVAAALEELSPSRLGPPRYAPEILSALERLVEVRIRVGERAAPAEGYRVVERTVHGVPCAILFDEARISQRRADVLLPIAAAGALGLLVALLLGLFAARTIARPVKRLADSVRGYAEGRFGGDTGPRGPGEIGELQEAFERLVRAIREGEARLRESERFAALGRLAGGIAHELRNPLTAIRMAVETALGGGEPDRADARRVALAEIERLDRTLRELLDFVRPRQLRPEEFEWARLLDDVAALMRPQCEHLGVRMEIAGAEGVVRADYDRLKQALLNLVLNGAQAQPEGGVVRLRARPGLVEVEDEGAGVSEEVRESLFEPFETTKEAGMGLGLAVVRQVALEHGAQVEFESGPRGTIFRLRFAS